MLGQPIFTSVFEINVIFSGANRVSAAFKLRFSSLEVFFGPKISAFPKSQAFGQTFLFCVSAAFQLAKAGCSPSDDFKLTAIKLIVGWHTRFSRGKVALLNINQELRSKD